MKRFAWLALATLALALGAPTQADATPVPGGEVMAAFAAVDLPSELAPTSMQAPLVLRSAFELEWLFELEVPLTSRPYGPSSLTTTANAVRHVYQDARCGQCGERPGGFQILLEFGMVLGGS